MKLHNFWRSSCSWRVRAALAHKGIEYEYVPVNLAPDVLGQQAPGYAALSALRQVPALEWEEAGETRSIAQSMAIIEYLEERYPDPSLLPTDPLLRARARQIAESVNAGIQPMQNGGFLRRLDAHGIDSRAFARDHIERGLRALEPLVAQTAGRFAIDDDLSLADIFLMPQIFNARGFGIDVDAMPTLAAIAGACAEHPTFVQSHPSAQPDALA